ncbi:Gamma-crystallin A [Caligus rogercresseyi]|uniref:Gamma-crystallin A n=1 Tax=Caligus rogercresseyi TaxID=217165 RepID=A0A7T8KE43_CALRO|nr:Gamma-crystallin A [Caligus rogercresseyi]
MKTLFAFALCFALGSGIPRGSKDISASCRAYTSPNYSGYNREFRDYIEALSTYNLDNSIQSAVVSGIWLFYEDTQYNSRDFGGSSFFGWGQNLRIPTFHELNRVFSSLRYSGVGENMIESTINFYDGAGFMGREQFYYGDSSYLNYDNFGKSIIITGCEPWTLYEDKHFRGDHICLYPGSTSSCAPGFFIEPKDFGYFSNRVSLKPKDFGYFSNRVSSVRRGCFSKKVYKSIPVPANSTRMFIQPSA